MKIKETFSQMFIAVFGGLVGAIISLWATKQLINQALFFLIIFYAIVFLAIIFIWEFFCDKMGIR